MQMAHMMVKKVPLNLELSRSEKLLDKAKPFYKFSAE